MSKHFDNSRLTVLRNDFGNDEVVRELATSFYDSVSRLHKRIYDDLKAGGAADLALAVHSLKGNCANIGATAMADLAVRMERAVRAGDLGECSALLKQSRGVFEEVREQIECFMRDGPT